MTDQLATEFKEQALFRLDESTRMVCKAFAELTDTDVWKRPNAASNSMGNLILHLCGNITQYAIASLSNSPDQRQRDAEFAARDGHSKTELLQLLETTVAKAKATIASQDANSLLAVRSVQGFSLSGIGIILHVVEHYSYHTGQIAFWTKQLKNKDLGFYDGMDLNVKNT
ncbi:MAG: DUF1572 domain-containing protein [Bacteroidetes bacterium]|nr:MAG: DUF1572 domain-containing protein [Bacteroidota bacterium]